MSIINNFFRKMGKVNLPDSEEISRIPKRLKIDAENSNINKITVRYFNQDFSKVIETIGFISHKTSIPIVYFEKPDKLAVIMFDDSTYLDITRNNMLCIDVCESYPYGLDKNSSLAKDLKVEYFNDRKELKLSSKSQELYYKTGCGYYVPVLLNNIPIPIIEFEREHNLTLLNLGFVKKKITITQNIIRQLSDVKLLERVGKKDNTAIMFAAILFTLLGIVLGAFATLWIVG